MLEAHEQDSRMIRRDIIDELSEVMDSHMKEHWEIHKEGTPISMRPYILRMLSEAYILGRVSKVEEDYEQVMLNQEEKDIERFSKFAKTLVNESIQETDRELQSSKRGSCQ